MSKDTRICTGCGDTFGSRYHEVAHSQDVDTASIEELEAAASIIDEYKRQRLAREGLCECGAALEVEDAPGRESGRCPYCEPDKE